MQPTWRPLRVMRGRTYDGSGITGSRRTRTRLASMTTMAPASRSDWTRGRLARMTVALSTARRWRSRRSRITKGAMPGSGRAAARSRYCRRPPCSLRCTSCSLRSCSSCSRSASAIQPPVLPASFGAVPVPVPPVPPVPPGAVSRVSPGLRSCPAHLGLHHPGAVHPAEVVVRGAGTLG